eukprot:CAMPEP_0180457180 /NCGR_PEP_ID=MMETSP1036_2-20121128/21687_1 /TAXON_ID=632150 /ORGANISM="Azadinium spinosum, Strain 3D9" /LENGTH=45 /DNA_ID= /DNA_START= /DNA_END= /DNA_ORIENTATION=
MTTAPSADPKAALLPSAEIAEDQKAWSLPQSVAMTRRGSFCSFTS